ncbi:UNVERIFIED_CONTAM: hypothetical protein HDU68_008125 [Siphonaria sp. JEL0065]|nr:hypothetical protein HDU68_008125 [Siphonaria sp. JEL0065]
MTNNESVPEEAFLASRTLIADPSGAGYNWTQTESHILFSARVGRSVTEADVTVECKTDSISIRVKDLLLLKGRLYATVAKDSVDVMIRPIGLDDLAESESDRKSTEKRPNPYFNIVIIRLQKNTAKNQWPLPIQGGIESNTDTDAHSLYLLANSLHNLGDSGTLKLMHAAAELGSISAMLKLAAWYEIGKEEMAGIPVSKSESAALSWHKRAGNAGNPEACYILMTTYASGSHNNPKSFFDALQWSRAALQSGFGEADNGGAMAVEQPRLYQTLLFQTGLLLMEGGSGIGEPKPEGAVSSWEIAAKEGHAQSSWNLGIFYLNGFGLPEPNVTKGIELIRTGMKAVKELSMPPQLQGLNQVGLDALVEMDAELRAQGSIVDVEKVKVMAALKKNGQLNSSTPKVAEPITQTQKKNVRRREKKKSVKGKASTGESTTESLVASSTEEATGLDWGVVAKKSFAVAIIGVGAFGLWKVAKGAV